MSGLIEDSERAELEAKYGQVWTTTELQQDFEVKGFCMGLVVVRRKADGAVGSLDFEHSPRYYHSWVADA